MIEEIIHQKDITVLCNVGTQKQSFKIPEGQTGRTQGENRQINSYQSSLKIITPVSQDLIE